MVRHPFVLPSAAAGAVKATQTQALTAKAVEQHAAAVVTAADAAAKHAAATPLDGARS